MNWNARRDIYTYIENLYDAKIDKELIKLIKW